MVPEFARRRCVRMDRWWTILNSFLPTRCCTSGTSPRPRPQLPCRLDVISWKWHVKTWKTLERYQVVILSRVAFSPREDATQSKDPIGLTPALPKLAGGNIPHAPPNR